MQITEVIKKTFGVCGGHACIRNTRIPVWTLVSLRQQGATEQELIFSGVRSRINLMKTLSLLFDRILYIGN